MLSGWYRFKTVTVNIGGRFYIKIGVLGPTDVSLKGYNINIIIIEFFREC